MEQSKIYNFNLAPKLFKSFFQGGFECSTHRRSDGKRLDLLESTLHDKYVLRDYQSLASHNIRTVRDGIRWHLIEANPGCYNWSSFIPMLRAALKSDTQVIWDLCHYGWPDHIDIWEPKFVDKFSNFASEVAKIIKNETDEIPFYSPINEISFWAWAGGDVAYFNPGVTGRGFELKQQLVRATVAAINAIRLIEPRARFVQAEPLINVISLVDAGIAHANLHNESQYQAWDMLLGRQCPELGGHANLLDIIGVNYYPYNQWVINGSKIDRDHPNYLPFASILEKVHLRYNRPIFISETGSEGNHRVEWLKYICDEVNHAILRGYMIEGICLYPIVDYPGWDDYRDCKTGLLGIIENLGLRSIYEPLASEIFNQQKRFNYHL